jgi:hypothetical protein
MAYGELPLRGIESRRYVSAEFGYDGGHRVSPGLIDVTVPNAARVADFLAGGLTNFAADRKAAAAVVESAPSIASLPAPARAFRRRAVRYLAADAGIRQFLDVGDGLVALGDTHGPAQAVDPTCRIVYVDSDPMMLDRTRATLTSTPEGRVACVEGDIEDVNGIVAAAGGVAILDASQPIAVLLMSTLAHVPSPEDAAKVVAALMDPAPSGSYLAMYHLASDLDPALTTAFARWNAVATVPIVLRSAAEIAALATGLDLVPPGLVPINDWRPGESDPRAEAPVPIYGLVARKR